MSYEERAEYEHRLSTNFTQQHGEEANNLRLCTNVYKNYSSSDIWVDSEWRKDTNAVILTD